MNAAEPAIQIKVDRTNAGQFFACCGLLELADRLWPGAEGWFEAMLPRLLPRCFYDLVIEVAIVRPGPIQGGMVHPYLRRRCGQEPVTYPNPAVEQVLAKTLGVPLFQEQVMRLAMAAAGFTPGEADKLRRAMGAWRRPGLIEQFRAKLRDGMLSQGLPAAFAEQLYEQIRGFGEYGFPEAHAASFALLAYVSAWLKCHYPAAFAAAILNSQPMGFYAPAQLVRDAQTHGVTVFPVDVNHSAWDCTLEPTGPDDAGRSRLPSGTGPVWSRSASGTYSLRLGFRLIKGLPRAEMQALAEARSTGRFISITDCARAMLSRPTHGVVLEGMDKGPRKHATPLLARLADADAFASLGLGRRAALWQVLSIGEELPLFGALPDEEDDIPCLPELPMSNEVAADYDTTGLSLKAHPIGLLRRGLAALGVLSASALADVPNKGVVRVAGLVLVRQRPGTAKGVIFVTLEDETGSINLIIWPSVWHPLWVGWPWVRPGERNVMPDNTDDSGTAFQELVRVLEEAVRAGVNSIGLEYKGRELIVFHQSGALGFGAARISKDLQQAVIEVLVKRAGLSRKSRGKMQVFLLGKEFDAVVERYDSFGEPAYNLTLKERKKKASR